MAKILVVEDEKQILDLIGTMLEQAGHTAVYAKNGLEGLQTYQSQAIDLVITDIMMPEKDGIETIRELKKCDPDAKIIAITGYRGRFNRLPAAEFLGAQHTLVKPFTKTELLEAVSSLLD